MSIADQHGLKRHALDEIGGSRPPRAGGGVANEVVLAAR
jgi:hypothetical protein